MNKEMICKNCKYHYIEELTFDYPQSCCSKISGTTEQWCKCNNFEYSDRYIEQLQAKVNQLETNRDEAIEYIENNKVTILGEYGIPIGKAYNLKEILERGKE